MAREARSSSLAFNLTAVVLAVAVTAMTFVSAAALLGVYDLAQDQAASRQSAYRQAISTEIALHLDVASRVLNRSAIIVRDTGTPVIDGKALSSQYDSGIEFIDQLIVASSEGTVSVGIPTYRAPQSVEGWPAADAAVREDPVFVYDTATMRLWGARSVTRDDREYIVLVRLRGGYLGPLLDQFASDEEARWVGVVDGEGSLVASSTIGPPVAPDSISFEASSEDAAAGSIRAMTRSGTTLWGQYGDIGPYSGLDWRVVVTEPERRMTAEALGALTPAVFALAISAIAAIAAAILVSQRLVAPIRQMERWAKDAVSGAYVRPIKSDRTDELGKLAVAFNALALRLNALHDLAQLLAGTSRLDQVLDGIMSSMGHIVAAVRIAVFLVDDDGQNLVMVRSRGLPAAEDLTVSLEATSWLAEVLTAAGPMTLEALEPHHARVLGLDTDEVVSVLAAPLIVGHQPLGVVAVFDSEERKFSDAELEMVRTFSAQAAVAVRNSRLFEFEAASRREAEALRSVAEELARPLGLDRVLEEVVERAETLFNVSFARVAIVQRAVLGLAPADEEGGEENLLRVWGRLMVLRPGELIVTAEPGEDPVVDAYLREHDGRQLMVVTVMRGTEPGAVLCFIADQSHPGLGQRERSLAAAFGKQISLALDNAYNFASATTRAANLETIFRISQAVSSSLQIKVVLNRVLDVVQKIFSADAVSLMQYNDSSRLIETAMARGKISSEILHFNCTPGHDIPGRVYETGVSVKIDDLEEVSGSFATMAIEQGLHSVLTVPLLARGRSVGVLTVFAVDSNMYTDEDMSLLNTFASQAAMAIDTAALYGREHDVSSILQESILPEKLPDFPEVEVSSIYLPVGQEAEIGGDYYDVFRERDGALMIAIGDVAGKGVQAATKTSMIKYSVRGLAAAGLSPSAILAEVNRMVSETGASNDIVTLWLGRLDAETETLDFANGGHPPGLVRHADGSLERLEPTGALLGAITSAPYSTETVRVSAGDTLLLYTDGVTEARRGNRFFGEGRVERALKRGGHPDEIAGRLLEALRVYVAGELRDDAAVLVLRVRGGQ